MKIILKGGKDHQLTDADLRIYKHDFPTVDVIAEIRAMGAWCKANPGRRKTARGINRFITSWLMRAAERAVERPKGVYATSHKQFANDDDLCKTSAEDKKRGEEQLARMQAMIEARKKAMQKHG